jgi:hypothetical protein
MGDRAGFIERLDAVEERLAAHTASAGRMSGSLTSADPVSGERWTLGQVWAHVAEFVPYWVAQLRAVVAGLGGEPVPFGRTSADPGRLAAIERDRAQPVSVLWSDAHAGIEQLRSHLLRLGTEEWSARGVHPTLGVMDADRIVEEFLVGHLEQHADQLDELARDGG